MQTKTLLATDAGYVLKCISSGIPEQFEVGRNYVTKINTDPISSRYGAPLIGDDWFLNWQQHWLYGIEGDRVLAKFIMVRTPAGRYVTRDNYPSLKHRPNSRRIDKRRLRRFMRNAAKMGVCSNKAARRFF